jgi:rubrerythrin
MATGVKRLDDEWWARVVHEFRSHVREESGFLESYEQLVASSEDESVRFLLDLIVGDERRHHDLFTSMADASVGEGAFPEPPALSADVARALLEPTERFLDAEREESKKLGALRKSLKPAGAETLWPLIVELMEIDTSKHIRILEFLRDRLSKAAK